MCIRIDQALTERLKAQPSVNAFKVLLAKENLNKTRFVLSPYQKYKWQSGKRECPLPIENLNGQNLVYTTIQPYGWHVYLDEEEAKMEVKGWVYDTAFYVPVTCENCIVAGTVPLFVHNTLLRLNAGAFLTIDSDDALIQKTLKELKFIQ